MIRISLFLALIVTLISCDKEPKPVLVTSKLSYKVDTIFSRRHKLLIDVEIDSLCMANKDVYLKEALDSIRNRDIRDIEELLNE